MEITCYIINCHRATMWRASECARFWGPDAALLGLREGETVEDWNASFDLFSKPFIFRRFYYW